MCVCVCVCVATTELLIFNKTSADGVKCLHPCNTILAVRTSTGIMCLYIMVYMTVECVSLYSDVHDC